MKLLRTIGLRLAVGLAVSSCSTETPSEFEIALYCVSDGWNEGNAALAADCFSPDTIYEDISSYTVRQGRKTLYEFFGGAEGRSEKMTMIWHDSAFDPESKTGFAEFSFHYGSWAHGVVKIQLDDGKISRWREYWIESDENWDSFTDIENMSKK